MERSEMIALRLDGRTYEAIGKMAGVTRQRIQHILSPPVSIRNYVVKKYKERCNRCGIWVGNSGHIHHQGDIEDNYDDIPNLELLCISCHRIEHHRRLGPTRITPTMDERNKLILSYHHQGLSSRKIAKLIGISFVQVCNVIKYLKGEARNLR